MRLKSWCFNWALFRKNMTRFWPIWVLSALVWMIVMPLMLVSVAVNGSAAYLQMSADSTVALWAGKCHFVAFVDAIICAMAVFSYLFQHRSAVAIHMMPMRRECLFITNYLSGLALMVLPMLINLGITLVLEAVLGCLNWTLLFMWFTAQMLANLFFYSWAVFCAGLTGNLVMYPILYVGLQLVPEVLRNMISSICGTLLRGFYNFPALDEAVRWFSPLENLTQNVKTVWWAADEYTRQYFLHGWKCLLVYFGVGLVLALAALAMYRIRRVETAGDVIAVPALRPVFRYFFTFVCAITIAGLLSALVFDSNVNTWGWKYVLVYLALLMAGGFIGNFAAQMMLNKTLTVFKRGWIGYGVCMLILVAAVCGLKLDLLGFETWLPEADQVLSVEVVNYNITLEGEEALRQVVALHTNLVDHLSEEQALVQGYYTQLSEEIYSDEDGNFYIDGVPDYEWLDYHATENLTLIYHMDNGYSRSRSYTVYLDEEQIADENSIAAQLQALVNLPEYTRKYHRDILNLDLSSVTAVDLNTYRLVDPDYYEAYYVNLTGEDARKVAEAIRQDVTREDGLKAWLLGGMDKNQGTLTIETRISGQIQIGEDYGDEKWYGLRIGSDWANTIRALSELGVLDEEHTLVSDSELANRDWLGGGESFDALTHSYTDQVTEPGRVG